MSSSSTLSAVDFSRPCPKSRYYDVFISFRGIDTRYGYTANLYDSFMNKELHTFMDVKLLGKSINSLFEEIGRSKLAVVVFSKRFASSHWCLRELETILQRVKDKEMLMIPIFYEVDVGELTSPTGETVKYLNAHVQKHGETAVQKWKDVVATLSTFSGMSYKNRYERDFIAEVIAKTKEHLKEWEETCIPKPNPKDVMWEGTKELRQVTSVDVHPTKPWVLLTPIGKKVYIWNYETRAVEKSFRVMEEYGIIKSAKFVPKKHWIVLGCNDMFVRVFDYNTSEKLKELKAHKDHINCVAVHLTLPYVLTASTDKLIKLWNWENDWTCQETFEKQSVGVDHIAFNPRDPHSFASTSKNFLKIWRTDSKVAEFTSDEHFGQHRWVEYFIGDNDRLYLLNNDKVWHYGSKTLVHTLEGHGNGVQASLVHSELQIILTTKTFGDVVRIWNKNTYQLLHEWDCDIGEILCFGFIKASEEVVIGCRNGVVVIKLAFAGIQSV